MKEVWQNITIMYDWFYTHDKFCNLRYLMVSYQTYLRRATCDLKGNTQNSSAETADFIFCWLVIHCYLSYLDYHVISSNPLTSLSGTVVVDLHFSKRYWIGRVKTGRRLFGCERLDWSSEGKGLHPRVDFFKFTKRKIKSMLLNCVTVSYTMCFPFIDLLCSCH